MNEDFEFHIKALIKEVKKIYNYGIYLSLSFISLSILLVILGNLNRLLLLTLFLALLFFSEFVYGYKLLKKFNWILTNYQIEKEKCLMLLIIKKVNFDYLKVELDTKDLSFATRYYMHSKKAYDLLNSKT